MQYSTPFYYMEAITLKRGNYWSLKFDVFFLRNENKPEAEGGNPTVRRCEGVKRGINAKTRQLDCMKTRLLDFWTSGLLE